jgi:hypothetical protein
MSLALVVSVYVHVWLTMHLRKIKFRAEIVRSHFLL